MPPILNSIGVHCACVGNHEFDHGLDQMEVLVNDCNFPWLLGNLLDKSTNEPFLGLPRHGLIHWQGHKIGVVGLVEKEWLSTLEHIGEDTV